MIREPTIKIDGNNVTLDLPFLNYIYNRDLCGDNYIKAVLDNTLEGIVIIINENVNKKDENKN